MNLRRAIFAMCACAPVALIATACARTEHPYNETTAAGVCDAMCARRKECAPGGAEGACRARCLDRGKGYLGAMRDDHASALASCVKGATCEDVGRENDAFVYIVVPKEKCWYGVAPKTTPVGERYISGLVSRATDCQLGAYTDKHEDEALFGGLSDAMLTDLADCNDRPCKNVVACIKATVALDR
jgi:hypothetical protein